MYPPSSAVYRILSVVTVAAAIVLTQYAQSVNAQPDPQGEIWGLDTSFGNNGLAHVLQFGSGELVYSRGKTVLLPNDKIVSGLEYTVQYGRLDDTGQITIRFTQDGSPEKTGHLEGQFIGVQTDGKLIVAAYTDHAFLTRYNTDLSLDSTFVMSTDVHLGDGGCCFAVQSDDRILVSTSSGEIRRLEPNGAEDKSFPNIVGPFNVVDSIVPHPNGTFLVQEHETEALRCSARVYSNDGIYLSSLFDSSYSSRDNHCGQHLIRFAPYPDGGFVWSRFGTAIFKSRSDGGLDRSFGDNGHVVITVGGGVEPLALADVAVQPDGKIVFIGHVVFDRGIQQFVMRYDADGSLDQSFGTHGIFYFPNTIHNYVQVEIIVQSDGRLVVTRTDAAGVVLMRLQSFPVRGVAYLPHVAR
jgi:uncharacterized delta-60 repeat protein